VTWYQAAETTLPGEIDENGILFRFRNKKHFVRLHADYSERCSDHFLEVSLDQTTIIFIFGLLTGALINSIYRAFRIQKLKENFEIEIQQIEARKSALAAPVLWNESTAQSLA
jgi:hypothetical protein